MATESLTPHQQQMVETWEHHLASEFGTKSVEETLSTMVDHGGYVFTIGNAGGGASASQVLPEGMDRIGTLNNFYSKMFIPQVPPDMQMVLLSRTVGHTQLVDEMLIKFTHSVSMDWLLPGIPPTNKMIELLSVVVVKFEGEKMKSEHVYWDQARVLVQAGLLERGHLPVAGAEAAHQLLKFHNSH